MAWYWGVLITLGAEAIILLAWIIYQGKKHGA